MRNVTVKKELVIKYRWNCSWPFEVPMTRIVRAEHRSITLISIGTPSFNIIARPIYRSGPRMRIDFWSVQRYNAICHTDVCVPHAVSTRDYDKADQCAPPARWPGSVTQRPHPRSPNALDIHSLLRWSKRLVCYQISNVTLILSANAAVRSHGRPWSNCGLRSEVTAGKEKKKKGTGRLW